MRLLVLGNESDTVYVLADAHHILRTQVINGDHARLLLETVNSEFLLTCLYVYLFKVS